jgi:hypothetical protein
MLPTATPTSPDSDAPATIATSGRFVASARTSTRGGRGPEAEARREDVGLLGELDARDADRPGRRDEDQHQSGAATLAMAPGLPRSRAVVHRPGQNPVSRPREAGR